MIAEILLGGIWLKYYQPGYINSPDEEPAYPYLDSVPPISESTTQESGSAQIYLSLEAFEDLQFPLGTRARIRNNGETLFDGVVADVTITSTILLQLEA